MKILKTFFILPLLTLLAMASICQAESVSEPTFDIAATPQFSEYRVVLADFLRKKKVKGNQEFCIVGYMHADQSKSAWVIWKQAGKLVLWEPGDDALIQSRRVLDLKRDVVENEAEIKGSTYLVTKAWVTQLGDDCNRVGVKVSRRIRK